jgi:hypothetical protein
VFLLRVVPAVGLELKFLAVLHHDLVHVSPQFNGRNAKWVLARRISFLPIL